MQRRGVLRGGWRLAVAAILLVSACHPPLTPAAIASMRIDTLWYATNRTRADHHLVDRVADSLEFGYYRIASASGVNAAYAALNIRIIDSTQLTESDFLAGVAMPSRDSANVVVVAVHGYATDHRKALHDGAESLLRSGSRARWVVFTWPSRGFGVELMHPGWSFLTSAYHADVSAATRSAPALGHVMQALQGVVGGSRLVLVSHSLGARVAGQMFLEDSALRERLQADPLRAVGFFAADVSRDFFQDRLIPAVLPTAQRVGLYASRNDGLLRFSRIVNGDERAGLISDRPIAMYGLESIDITDAPSSENWWRRTFGTHHGMRRESGALHDFFNVLVAGRPPFARMYDGTAALQATRTWKLLPVR